MAKCKNIAGQKFGRLGVYENIEDAISARREAEMKYFGEYTQ